LEAIAPGDDEAGTGRIGPISYSQLDTFRRCPHRYYLRHVIGLPGLPQSSAAQFGTSFHEAIALEARARRRGEAISAATVRDWVAAGDHGAEPPLREAASTVDPVTTYLQAVDRRAEPLLIEEAFTLRLDDVVLNGVLDRVHRLPDGEVEIVDYKTDRHARTEEQVRAGLQLQIYALACREAFPEIQPPPTRAAMVFVRTGDRVETRFSAADLEAARGEILSRARTMRSVGPDTHHASVETCRWCQYRLTCRHAISGDTP
jgi:RecB family exonuclease